MHADEYAALVASRMPEKVFQSQLMSLARSLGWRSYHTAISYGSACGFPDVVMVRPPRLIFAELKRQSAKSQPTADQQSWLDDLEEVGTALSPGEPAARLEVYLWRPIDICTDTITEVLR